MAKETTPITPPLNPVVVQAALGGQNLSADIQQALLAYLNVTTQSAQRAEEDFQRKQDEDKKLQMLKIESAKEERMRRLAGEAICGHRREDGKSAIRGNRDGSHRLVCICLHCYKTWCQKEGSYIPVDGAGRELDPNLMPNDSQIGGLA